jgi:hypothetical protein
MLLAKLLTQELKFDNNSEDDEDFLPLQIDPTIPKSFIDWATNRKPKYYDKLIIKEGIFTPYELTRQVHLTFTLNIMSTYVSDYYNRNDFVSRHLEEFAENFPRKDEIYQKLEDAAGKFLRLKIKKKSYWYNKANAFSLMTLFTRKWAEIEPLDEKMVKTKLEQFENYIPADYQIAAKEGVNNKAERLTRNQHLENLLLV